ncbi:MFS transporter [Paracoccus laeviglucosivorans]|uniref:MFS transporter, YNFM family, putative membrane transport protein n=1 Tax=Paracoccus laeviglucosivorans TaxID=1197861 RepID=A0A521EVB1_9RHOB|nr:MFS transporter [Paracoccus laeviglucosivorans]SMO87040.1 MFS transporter, YNFM family, putative membrane transport protein [Paracoccus laeviglucosivorans]
MSLSEPTVAFASQDLRADTYIRQGTPLFSRVRLALFVAGFSSFALIYCVQPLLPEFARSFGLTPASSSMALSLTTGCLAVSIMVMAGWSQRLGRKGVMVGSMLVAAMLNLAGAMLPGWNSLLIARALEGLALGGVPAVAMAYLAEEIAPEDLGKAMGLYIGGTAFGAMAGRVGMGILAEFGSWRLAMGGLGVLCLLAALAFAYLLPPSRNFQPQQGNGIGFHLRAWRAHMRNPALQRLYFLGFCLTSIFVTVFNYTTFRLSDAPFGLGQTAVSMIFLAFAFGVVSSSVAGGLVSRIGRRPLLVLAFSTVLAGVVVSLAGSVGMIFLAVALIATGFFIGHSVASSAVGAAAQGAKGHAASLYLLFYYAGSSITGVIGGWFWQDGGWSAVAALTAAIAVLGILVSAFGPRTDAVRPQHD